MKFHIAYPISGTQKVLNIEDEHVIRAFVEKRISQVVDGAILGSDWEGYLLKITGGNDLQGFPMKQGVLTQDRVRLLLSKGQSCYRPRKRGERKRKSVRGCIVSSQISILNLIIVKKGAKEIDGLTNVDRPKTHYPKRASTLRKFLKLDKKEDLRRFVIGRPIQRVNKKTGETYTAYRNPKIQRLVTPARIARKRAEKKEKERRIAKSQALAQEYNEIVKKRLAERKARLALLKKRSLSRKLSAKKSEKQE